MDGLPLPPIGICPPSIPKKLAYVVTEDWAFYRHRLPMALAAKAAGYEVHILTRVDQRRAEIEREGFTLHPLTWRRSRISPLSIYRSVMEVCGLLRAIGPDIVHNVAVKPAIIGSLAARNLPGVGIVNSINGLGSAFMPTTARGRLMKRCLEMVLPQVISGVRSRVIVQNPQDMSAMIAPGINASRPSAIPLRWLQRWARAQARPKCAPARALRPADLPSSASPPATSAAKQWLRISRWGDDGPIDG